MFKKNNKVIPIKQKKNKSGLKKIIFILILVLLIILAIFSYFKLYKHNKYTIITQKKISQGSFVAYEKFASNIVRYSKDGIVYLNEEGKEIWIESYEMKNPYFASSKNYFAIADIKGNKIYIFSKQKKMAQINTSFPITKIDISDAGVVVAILESATASYINFFDNEGKYIDVSIKSKLDLGGYPTDLTISPKGNQLMVAYQYLDSASLKGRIVFYDFSEVGKSVSNRLVGGFDEEFSNSLVARVNYFNSIYSFAAADTGIYFFSSKNLLSPELIKKYLISENNMAEIRSIAYNDEYLALVYKNTKSEKKYRFELYKADSKMLLSKEFDEDYTYFDIDDKEIYLYTTDSRLLIYNDLGILKLDTHIDLDLKLIKKNKFINSYVIFTPDSITNIKLK